MTVRPFYFYFVTTSFTPRPTGRFVTSVRPMFSVMCGLSCSLFMVVGCSYFYVVVFFFTADIYTFMYFTLFLKGFFI